MSEETASELASEGGLVCRALFSIMNERQFTYRSDFGTHFLCNRADFREEVVIANAPEKPEHAARDVAEMIGYHACNIWPNLNGFQGYDTIRFRFENDHSLPPADTTKKQR